MRLALLLLGLSGCLPHIDLQPPYDSFVPVHFSELPADPYDAGYSCRVVSRWAWPEMECAPTDAGG